MLGSRSFSLLLMSLALVSVSGCDKNKSDTTEVASPTVASPSDSPATEKPAEPGLVEKALDKPEPGTAAYSMSKLDDDQKKVLDALIALNGKPIETLTPEEARKQPTPKDAVLKVLEKDGKPTAPEEVAKVEDKQIPGAAGKLPVRIYTPKKGEAPYPVVVYFHGGGWVIANNDVYDASPRAIANQAEAVVVAVDYREAPEHKFPAAHDDAFAAYKWVLKNAKSFQGDASRVAVLGESAGGNLAANVAISARDKKEKAPLAAVLVYPVASSDMESESYREHANAKPLSKAMIPWFTGHFFRTPADGQDPRINLVQANLKGLPPTTIINAEVDPLRSEGELLAKKLEEAGVDVKQKTYEGVAHEFFGQGVVVGDGKDAVGLAASRLQDAFKK